MGKLLIRYLYLDVCALCRPYDDQSALRIRLETDAVFLILEAIRQHQYELVVSPVHFQEIKCIEDDQERIEIEQFINLFGNQILSENKNIAKSRTLFFCEKGLGVADAAHLVFAEISANCLISCDDRFVKRGRKVAKDCLICGPVEFCEMEGLR